VPRNLAFGGAELDTMFITAGDSVYSLQTKVRGMAAY
jgi:sugar lactone lactonase YvrE